MGNRGTAGQLTRDDDFGCIKHDQPREGCDACEREQASTERIEQVTNEPSEAGEAPTPKEKLLKLISDWRQRAGDPPAHWTVGLLSSCCREEINECANELEEEL